MLKVGKIQKKISGYFINTNSEVTQLTKNHGFITISGNKNTFPTKQLAEAALALSQLLQLMYRINGGREANWNEHHVNKFVICTTGDLLAIDYTSMDRSPIYFFTEEDRDIFLKNHRELLRIAKPLL